MELKSTASFKDIDVDAMLEHTTFDQFMKGLYMNKIAAKSKDSSSTKKESNMTDFERMWQTVMVTEDDKDDDLKL
jgi:hypothetical protein